MVKFGEGLLCMLMMILTEVEERKTWGAEGRGEEWKRKRKEGIMEEERRGRTEGRGGRKNGVFWRGWRPRIGLGESSSILHDTSPSSSPHSLSSLAISLSEKQRSLSFFLPFFLSLSIADRCPVFLKIYLSRSRPIHSPLLSSFSGKTIIFALSFLRRSSSSSLIFFLIELCILHPLPSAPGHHPPSIGSVGGERVLSLVGPFRSLARSCQSGLPLSLRPSSFLPSSSSAAILYYLSAEGWNGGSL